MAVPLLSITAAPLELATLVDAVSRAQAAQARNAGTANAGGIACFLGMVRSPNQGRRVLHLEYEAYEPLAVRVFERIRDEMVAEWPGTVLALHHRIGRLEPGEVSVAIVVASRHRAAAFAGCRYAIERVKQIAPIWKREAFEGGEIWIEGAVATPDDEAARREALKLACM
jgi:molybdopterin synthase catalytic subunit